MLQHGETMIVVQPHRRVATPCSLRSHVKYRSFTSTSVFCLIPAWTTTAPAPVFVFFLCLYRFSIVFTGNYDSN